MASPAPDPAAQLVSKGPAIVATSVVFLVLSWLTVSLRFWVRQIILGSFGLDDWMMGLALLTFTLFCVFLIVEVDLGGGSHVNSTDTLGELLKFVLLSECFYIASMIFFKISLGVFLLRIVVRKWHTVFIYVVMAISTTYGIAYFFFALFQCGDPSQILENKLAGRCQSATTQLGMGYTHAAVQALADWAFAILPVFIIWSANMDRRTKVSVGFILMLGAAGSTATLVRFKFESGLVSEDDFFFAAANIAITCTIEAGLGITAGSLATLKPLFRCCFYRVRETFSSTERRARYEQQKSAHSETGRRAPANTFRPYGNTTIVGEATAKTQTTIIGNDRASSSSSGDDVSMKELVVRDQSLGDSSFSRNLPAGWKNQDDIPDPNRSWFRIEKTTDVEVTNETRSRHEDV